MRFGNSRSSDGVDPVILVCVCEISREIQEEERGCKNSVLFIVWDGWFVLALMEILFPRYAPLSARARGTTNFVDFFFEVYYVG